jgi:M6 family metalloprotease-like protein
MNKLSFVASTAAAAAIAFLAGGTAPQAAPLTDIPLEKTQPDGRVVYVLASGDEYFNWLHDEQNHIIVQDPDSGFYVYAGDSGGRMKPTRFIVGADNPALAGIAEFKVPPGMPKTNWKKAFVRAGAAGASIRSSSTTGTINGLVVFIRFQNEPEWGKKISVYDTMFNSTTGGVSSVTNFFHEASYGALTLSSTFYPPPSDGNVVTWQDDYNRNYYRPYSNRNPEGYTDDNDRAEREQTMIKRAVDGVAPYVPSDLDIDHDNDGYVDAITFIVSGSPDGWQDLLWPHAWVLYYPADINGKRVSYFDFQLQTVTSTGVLSHELSHVLGFPDLYHYYYGGNPIGPWDLMAGSANPPQHHSAYMKYRYGQWIASIPEINQYDQYTINPITSPDSNSFKIKLPGSDTEYLVVEYRRKVGTFDSSIPATGMLVYRVNMNQDGMGNSEGPPDELYVFRQGGSSGSNGNISMAAVSSDVGVKELNNNSDPYLFISNGTLAGISIYDIGSAGSTIHFRYKVCGCDDKQCGNDGCGENCGGCNEGMICDKRNQCIFCTPDCTGRECGDDGCEGSCGECTNGCKTYCENNACGPSHHFTVGCGPDGVYWMDSCGGMEDLKTKCGDGQVCMPGVGVFECCTVESDETFCKRRGKLCGDYTAVDNCKQEKTVNCGSCGKGLVCGEENICITDPNPPGSGCSCSTIGPE